MTSGRKILVTLGDSWPCGAELGNGRRYGEILRDELMFDELHNYGSGGASNEDMCYQLQDFLQNHHQPDQQVTVIGFLTNPARTCHWPRFLSWQNPPAQDDRLKEIYLHFHRPEHEVMRSSLAISALQFWCRNLGFKDFYFAGWVRYLQWLPGVDQSRIWKGGRETAADWFGASDHNGEHLINVETNPYIRPNFAHPNQLGHDLIAEKLKKWIHNEETETQL
jgi:hypothetical protein